MNAVRGRRRDDVRERGLRSGPAVLDLAASGAVTTGSSTEVIVVGGQTAARWAVSTRIRRDRAGFRDHAEH